MQNDTAIVGDGLIGRRLQKFISHSHVFDSESIDLMPGHDINTVYVAAPSSNRVWANQNPEQDWDSVKKLRFNLLQTAPKKVILISTVDTQVKPDSPYGRHRLDLENFIRQTFHYHHVLRLPSLIGNDIKKNMIYDIKHATPWRDSINPETRQQWYILDDLEKDLTEIMSRASMTVDNLVSEPVPNRDILEQFYHHNTTSIHGDHYDLRPYRYTRERILEEIRSYMQE